MSELLFQKAGRVLAPATDESVEWLAKKKHGATIAAEVHEMRNGGYFRKWWSLVSYAFDEWSETCEPMEYKGQPVLPSMERFRKDVTILAGFYEATWNINGDMRVEAMSISWAKMDEETFGKLYNATIHALTEKVFNGKRCRKLSDFDLRQIHEAIWEYAA